MKQTKQVAAVVAGYIVLSTLYKYTHRFLTREPGPYGLPLVGSALAIGRDPSNQHNILNSWSRLYGDYFTMETGLGKLHVFSHPDDVDAIYKNVAVFADRIYPSSFSVFLHNSLLALSTDEMWKKHRATFSQLFTDKYLASYYSSIVTVAHTWLDRWDAQGGTDDLASDMNAVALGVLGMTVLGVTVTDFLSKDDVRSMATYLLIMDLVPYRLRGLPIWPGRARAFEADRRLTTITRQLIAKAKEGTLDPHCLLTIAVQARNADGVTPWSEEEIISEVKGFLLAGFETTSNTLSFAFHLLAVNPAVQNRARALVRSCFTGDYGQLKSLDYIWAIFRETLRLYPTVPINARVSKEAATVGKVCIPANTIVVLLSSHHRDEAFFEAPLEFRPERWLDKDGKRLEGDPFQLVRNFGGGRRQCIGMRFAEEEVMVLISLAVDRFEISPHESCDVPFLKTAMAVTISPASDVRIIMKPKPK